MDSFRRIVGALRTSHRAAAHLNLTGAQLFVLNALASAGKPLSVGEVAARTHTDPSTVSVVVSRLVKRGLVRRVRSSDDNRRLELTLTRKGSAIARRAPATVAQEQLAVALDHLSERQASTLQRLLEDIVIAMGEADRPAPMLFDSSEPRRRR